MRKSIIVAAAHNGVIGKDGKLPWHLPGDLKRFKTLTMGHTLIMGRKTYESLPPKVRPLPGRTTITLTRGKSKWTPIETEEDTARRAFVHLAASLNEAFEAAEFSNESEVFVCGGGEVYREALPLVDRVYLTVVEQDFEGDTYFAFGAHVEPSTHVYARVAADHVALNAAGWRLTSNERGEGELPHRFEIWDRVR